MITLLSHRIVITENLIMTTWTDDELGRFGKATELQLTSTRPDGTLRPYVTMWAVRSGDDLYVRSGHLPASDERSGDR
jgi:hypothetical protein